MCPSHFLLVHYRFHASTVVEQSKEKVGLVGFWCTFSLYYFDIDWLFCVKLFLLYMAILSA
jgi:hypothetical protein